MIYVALFRGINVGGHHIVKMADLTKLFVELGMTNVKTYIQSGNIVFAAKEPPAELQEIILQGFAAKFGFEPDIMIRSMADIKKLIEGLPFSQEDMAEVKDKDPDTVHLYVYFLDDSKTQQALAKLLENNEGPDLTQMFPGAIYTLFQTSIRLSALAAKITKLGHTTARNWNTVNKIYDLMKSTAE